MDNNNSDFSNRNTTSLNTLNTSVNLLRLYTMLIYNLRYTIYVNILKL